jgi:hypothetical protein
MTNEVALAEAASGQDPAAGLRAARALRELAERLEVLQVQNARQHGWSWQEIAVFLGVSKQAVHKKYSGLLATISPGGVHRGRRTAVRGSSTAGGLGGSSPRTSTAGAPDVAPGANTGDDDV